MPTSTTNYGLIKPGTDDPILVGQLNDNMDTIDTVLKDHSDKIDAAALGIKYKGEVNYYADLPNNAEIGDAYTVKYAGSSGTTPDGTEYVWGTASGTNQWINFSKDSYTKAEVDALLALKQNALTTAQLAAVNSGIDSTKVAQIESNKNNISLLTPTVKGGGLDATSSYSLMSDLTQYAPFSQGYNPAPIVRISAMLSTNMVGIRGIILSLSNDSSNFDNDTYMLAKSEQSSSTIRELYVSAMWYNSESTEQPIYVWVKAAANGAIRAYSMLENIRV